MSRPVEGPVRQLHIVTGKGGVGKTTMAAAMACGLARQGRRVLLCEVEGRAGIGELFDAPGPCAEETRLARTPAGGEVFGLSITAEEALREYLASFYRLGLAGRMMDRFGVFDFATSIAPGLSDVLLTGKVYEAVRRRDRNRKGAYSAVVLDAPPTGRIARFLNVHEAVSGLAKVGPIHNQASSITRLFRSEQTVLHLVSLLEDMPVTETIEAVDDLAPTGIQPVSVICNKVTGELSPEDVALIRGAAPAADPPALDEDALADLPSDTTQALGAQLVAAADRTEAEAEWRHRLAGLELSMVDVARSTSGVDQGFLFETGTLLADTLDLEG